MIEIFDGLFNRRVRNISLTRLEDKNGYFFKADYFDCGNLYNTCSYFLSANYSFIKINDVKYDYSSMLKDFDKIQVILEKEDIKMALEKLP